MISFYKMLLVTHAPILTTVLVVLPLQKRVQIVVRDILSVMEYVNFANLKTVNSAKQRITVPNVWIILIRMVQFVLDAQKDALLARIKLSAMVVTMDSIMIINRNCV